WFASSSPPAQMRAAFAGTPAALGLDPRQLRDFSVPETRALRFTAIGGRWWIVAEGPDGLRTAGTDGATALDPGTIAAAASGALAGGPLRSMRLLRAYDAYWYPHGTDPRPLPILRLRFGDAAATWLHVDPRDGTILQRLDRSGRINRWLFDATHRLDLPILTGNRAVHDGAQWILNLLAAGIAMTGIVAGWRRLRRIALA
ncbi:MAG: PepSY domain-containing protein, partial [Parafilimonas terrae]|nr:PepSY domain-containing protein [Parafilimonas terrae]